MCYFICKKNNSICSSFCILPSTNIFAGRVSRCRSLIRIDNASTALKPVAANSITYVFNLISEHAFRIALTSSFDNASLLFLIALGIFTFSLNFLGLISTSEYSREVLHCYNSLFYSN